MDVAKDIASHVDSDKDHSGLFGDRFREDCLMMLVRAGKPTPGEVHAGLIAALAAFAERVEHSRSWTNDGDDRSPFAFEGKYRKAFVASCRASGSTDPIGDAVRARHLGAVQALAHDGYRARDDAALVFAFGLPQADLPLIARASPPLRPTTEALVAVSESCGGEYHYADRITRIAMDPHQRDDVAAFAWLLAHRCGKTDTLFPVVRPETIAAITEHQPDLAGTVLARASATAEHFSAALDGGLSPYPFLHGPVAERNDVATAWLRDLVAAGPSDRLIAAVGQADQADHARLHQRMDHAKNLLSHCRRSWNDVPVAEVRDFHRAAMKSVTAHTYDDPSRMRDIRAVVSAHQREASQPRPIPVEPVSDPAHLAIEARADAARAEAEAAFRAAAAHRPVDAHHPRPTPTPAPTPVRPTAPSRGMAR